MPSNDVALRVASVGVCCRAFDDLDFAVVPGRMPPPGKRGGLSQIQCNTRSAHTLWYI